MERPDGIVDFEPDPELYPFESKWFDSSVGPIHYIDEGQGRPLLLFHGNPDWRETAFPQATVIRLDTASHYLQEDEPEQIAQAIADAYGPNNT